MNIHRLVSDKWSIGFGRVSRNLIPITVLLMVGCKSPFDRTRDASGGGTGTIGSSPTYVVFSNELKTGGGAFEYPGGENQTLSFTDTSNPISYRSIRYNWTGATVAGQSVFAGFDLMDTVTQATYSSTQGRDLRAAGYTKVTFYARGSLSTNTVLKVEVSADGNPNDADPCITLSTSGNAADNTCLLFGQFPNPLAMPVQQLTSSWQQYTINVPNSSLANVKDFFKATFVFTPVFSVPAGQGGTAYFDQIQYQ
jgi:hypothetical protein